jgi:hypothetical protein
MMRSNVPKYLVMLFEFIEMEHGIQLSLSASDTINVNGASEIIQLEIFHDFSEAYMLMCYKHLLINCQGLGRSSSSSGNIRLFAAIYEPGKFPPKSTIHASIADYTAEFDFLMSLGEEDANLIATQVKIRGNQYKTSNFFVTVGSSFDIGIRSIFYSALKIYQDDLGLKMPRSTPSFFTAADVAIREFLAIFFCKIHPEIGDRMTNQSGGGDSIRNIKNFNYLDAGNYYHLSLPGIPLLGINIIKSNSEISKWKSEKFIHLEKLSEFTVERVSMRYPELSLCQSLCQFTAIKLLIYENLKLIHRSTI